MNSIREFEIRRRFLKLLGRASVVVVLTVIAALPSHAYSFYSGASVGSDGTVYGWSVTDATPPPGMHHMAYVAATLTSPKGRVAYYGQISAPSTVTQNVSLPFDASDLGTYVETGAHSGFCYTCVCWWFQNMQSMASASNAATLFCGAAVTRGQGATCTVSNYGSATISNWKFTDGLSQQVTVSASTGTTANTWSGTVVQSGTVSTTVSYLPQPITSPLTVIARVGWAFTSASPVQEPNGGGTGACAGGLPSLTSPPISGSNEGYSCLKEGSSYSSQTVLSGGPNSGYTYITSATNMTIYQWEIVPDLANSSSQFYQAQCGNYNVQTNPNGFISGANLAAQTQRHEIGSVQGHWGEYNSAQNNTANNVGLVYEGLIAPPGVSIGTAVGNSPISTDQSNISSKFLVEPYPINEDQNGVFLGNINFAPYQSCQ